MKILDTSENRVEIITKDFIEVIKIFNYFNIDLLKIFKNKSTFKSKIKKSSFCTNFYINYIKNIFDFDDIETKISNKISFKFEVFEQLYFKAINVNTNIACNFDIEIRYIKLANGSDIFVVSVDFKSNYDKMNLLKFINEI